MRLPKFLLRNKLSDEERTYYVSAGDMFRSDPGWFQKAADVSYVREPNTNTAVYSCVNILSQEVASLYADHWIVNKKTGAREKVSDSAVVRVLRKPNGYQTSSDFWMFLTRGLLFNGASFGAATRNGRNEVSAIHPLPPKSCSPMVAENGDVYYGIGTFGDDLFRPSSTLPAHNVLSLRINCNRHPLIGETPLSAFAASANTGSAIQASVARFFRNMARPSGVLTTPKSLTKKQIDELREQWAAVSQGANVGQTPVLHSQLTWEPITMSATDAEVIASYNLSIADIAMAYRVPLFMLGDLSKATFRNVETLMRVFYTSSLRFYLEHIENALNELFGLDGINQYIEFDIESGLLRGDLEQRMTALAKGVQGGVLTPNEARKKEELPPIEGGDDAFLQRQMIPISAIKAALAANLEAMRIASENVNNDDSTDDDKKDEDDKDEDNEKDRAIDQRLRVLEEDDEDPADSFSDLMLKLGVMVNAAPRVEHRTPVVNVSTPVSVDARLDATKIGAAIRDGFNSMKSHNVNLSPTIVLPSQERHNVINVSTPEVRPVINVESPVVNVTTSKQEAPVVNVTVPEVRPVFNMEAPVVNVAVPKQDTPVVNVSVPEQKAPVVNVAVPKQDTPVINVSVPEQKAPIINVPKQDTPVVNVSVPEQKAPIVNVSVPEQAAPVINVAVPKQAVPVVNVAVPKQDAPMINVTVPKQDVPVVNVSVPEQKATVVNVAAPEVHVASPVVNVQVPEQPVPVVNVTSEAPQRTGKTKTIFKRDANGEIIEVVNVTPQVPRTRKTKTTFKRDKRGEIVEGETTEEDE